MWEGVQSAASGLRELAGYIEAVRITGSKCEVTGQLELGRLAVEAHSVAVLNFGIGGGWCQVQSV